MKKLIILVLLAVVLTTIINAKTYIHGGKVSGTWDLKNSPYHITKDVTVEKGSKLIIEPGVEIFVHGSASIIINGFLDAQGTYRNPIIVEPIDDSTEFVPVFRFIGVSDIIVWHIWYRNLRNRTAVEIDSSHNITFWNCRFENIIIDSELQPPPPQDIRAVALFITHSTNIGIFGCRFINNTCSPNDMLPLILITKCMDISFANNLVRDNSVLSVFVHGDDGIESNAFIFNANTITHNICFSTVLDIQVLNPIISEFNDNNINNNFTTSRSPGLWISAGRDVVVLRNHIYANLTTDPVYGFGGGLYIGPANDSPTFTVSDNWVFDNSAAFGGGIFIGSRDPNFLATRQPEVYHIENNYIFGNTADIGGGIYCSHWYNNNLYSQEVNISFNAISSNIATIAGGIFCSRSVKAEIVNNVVAYNTGDGIVSSENDEFKIINNIVWKNTGDQIVNLSGTNYPVNLYHNVVYGDPLDYQPPAFVLLNNLIFTLDPDDLFIDPFTHNWYTRLDFSGIGYDYPYATFIGLHEYDGSLTADHRRFFTEGIHWISFPKLSSDGLFITYPPLPSFSAIAYTFGSNVQQIYARNNSGATYSAGVWTQNNLLGFNQRSGYKIDVTSDFENIVDGTTLEPTWPINLHETENWVGYFLPETQLIKDALPSDIFGSVYQYKTKYGSYTNMHLVSCRNFSGPCCVHLQTQTISFGEMIVLEFFGPNPNRSMVWNRGMDIQAYTPPATMLFSYQELPDYLPIYIEIDTDNPPDEIAIFVNGICKGAAVFHEVMTEVRTYLEPSDFGEEIEIVFGYKSRTKSPHQVRDDFAVVNPTNQNLEYTRLIASPLSHFHRVKITDQNERAETQQVKPIVQLHQNFPNPFNPETQISFYLSHPDNIKLNIYNIRGQKVAELFAGEMVAGKHSILWDGKDNANKSVASGIYFYKLETSFETVIKKMALIK